MKAKGAAAVASFFPEDGVLVPPVGAIVKGREAISHAFGDIFKPPSIHRCVVDTAGPVGDNAVWAVWHRYRHWQSGCACQLGCVRPQALGKSKCWWRRLSKSSPPNNGIELHRSGEFAFTGGQPWGFSPPAARRCCHAAVAFRRGTRESARQ